MKVNKRIIMYTGIAVILLGVAITGTILVLSLINNQNAAKTRLITKDSVNVLRDEAEEARKNNDYTEAKRLLLVAQRQVKELPKTDETVKALVDIEAQLFLLKNADTSE